MTTQPGAPPPPPSVTGSDPAVAAGAGGAVAPCSASASSVLLGDPTPIRLAVAAFLAGGHVLLEDIPGVGKTLLAKALAAGRSAASFGRVQGTPDLLPSDLTGVRCSTTTTPVDVPPRTAVQQRRPRRRAQPGHAPHPVGAARGHGRTARSRSTARPTRCPIPSSSSPPRTPRRRSRHLPPRRRPARPVRRVALAGTARAGRRAAAPRRAGGERALDELAAVADLADLGGTCAPRSTRSTCTRSWPATPST